MYYAFSIVRIYKGQNKRFKMRILPILPSNYINKFPNRQKKKTCPSFASTSSVQNFPYLSAVMLHQAQALPNWIKDPILVTAMNHLENLQFDDDEVKHIQSLGVILPFLNGKEAVEFINNSNIRIRFAALASPGIHAQYDFDSNFININEIYKNTQSSAEILAIASAILHEAGHGKDKDAQSSLQEELNCLATNVLAHRAFSKKYPNIFSNSNALIIKDGTSLYSDLFFDNDPNHINLIKRLNLKYGFLPVGDFNHPPCDIAIRAKNA